MKGRHFLGCCGGVQNLATSRAKESTYVNGIGRLDLQGDSFKICKYGREKREDEIRVRNGVEGGTGNEHNR